MHRVDGGRRFVAVVSTTAVLVASVIVVGTGGLLLGPVQPAAAAVPFPILPSNATGLATVNAWRAASGLAPVVEDTSWSAGDVAHSTYIVETGDLGHDEDGGGPFATPEGALAGANGNVAASADATKTDRHFIDQFITAPFHAAGVLDPTLVTSGFGSYRKVGATPYPAAATLDVLRGRTGPAPTTPTLFPGNDSALPGAQQAYHGGESPDPLAPCAGFNPGGPINTGVPIFALMPDAPIGTTTATLEQDGVPVPSADVCVYDENSYTNPVPDEQTLGRQVLASRHQIVVVPRLPLVPGSVYSVSITAAFLGDPGPTVTTWGFTAETYPEVSIGNAAVVEGNARMRQLRFTVSLSKPYSDTVTVSYSSQSGSATAGLDFVAKTGQVSFEPGTTAAYATINVKGDLTAERQEDFTVALSSPANAVLNRAVGTGTIFTDDTYPSAAVQVSVGNASVVEGDAGNRILRFPLTLSNWSPTAPVTVRYRTVAATASSADFTSRSGTATIAAGALGTTLNIEIKVDAVPEPSESFTVLIWKPTGAVLGRTAGAGLIMDDD